MIYKDRLLGHVELAGSTPGSPQCGLCQEGPCSGDGSVSGLALSLPPALVLPLIPGIHQAGQVEGLALRRGIQDRDVCLGRQPQLPWPTVD